MTAEARAAALLERIQGGERRALAMAVSIVEDNLEGRRELLNAAYRAMHDRSLIVGVTGSGGSGKSTLIDKLIGVYTDRGKTVGVLAVDPSSPYSGGAVLGDRVRMAGHNTNPNVFIRSLGSRGALGGLSDETQNALYLYKNFPFDVILLESLGVGQDETVISSYVDVTAVVLVPGFGDTIQMAKAGIQEIADLFIINKADKPDADTLENHLTESIAGLPPDSRPRICRTVASEGRGVEAVLKLLDELGGQKVARRPERRARRIATEIETGVLLAARDLTAPHVADMVKRVLAGEVTPFDAADEIGEKLMIKSNGNKSRGEREEK